MNISKYKLVGVDSENNRILVNNTEMAGAPMELNMAFVMGSGRLSRFFSIEDRIILNRLYDGEIDVVDAPHKAIVSTKVKLI